MSALLPRCWATFVACAIAVSCRAVESSLRLVETAPTETSLDHANIAETAPVWIELIDGARASIELAHFYASNVAGSRLEGVVAALERAAARGVAIRFLADAGFYGTYSETLDRLGLVEGIELRLYDLRSLTGGVLHQKTMIVDGARMYIGSANFDWRALEHIQELGVLVDSEALGLAVGDAFELDWALAAGADEPAPRISADAFPIEARHGDEVVLIWPGLSPLELLDDSRFWDLDRLVEWIDGAERAVRVQLLSYHANERNGARFGALDDALRRAAARGVAVRLLVAHWSQRGSRIAELQELQRAPGLDVAIVTVPEHSSGFLPFARVAHAKYCVVDDERAWVGTSNWSRDYFEKSRNAGVFVEGRSFAASLSDFFEGNWSSEYTAVIDPEAAYDEPRVAE